MFHTEPLAAAHRPFVDAQISESWAEPYVVARGVLYDTRTHPGFAALIAIFHRIKTWRYPLMKTRFRLSAVLLAFCLALSLPINAVAAPPLPDPTVETARIAAFDASGRAVGHYKNAPLESWWDVLALTSAKADLAGFSLPDLTEATLTENAAGLAGRILALLALGENPYTFYPARNIVAELLSLQKEDGSFGYLNETVFAVLALERTAPDAYRRDDALRVVVAAQLPDGGFAFSGNTGDADMTGMALLALSVHMEITQASVEKAAAFLNANMTASGGFISPWSETKSENACSAAAALSGLCAVGRGSTPEAAMIAKNLIGFQLSSGAFAYEPDGGADAYATAQALIALGDFYAGNGVFSRLSNTAPPVEPATLWHAYTDAGQIAEWARAPVLTVYENGLLVGSSGRFRPLDTVTRAELSMILWRLDDLRLLSARTFTDVPSGRWYAQSASYAVSAGLMDAPSNRFRPTDNATREEVAAALARLYKLDTARAEKALTGGEIAIADLSSAAASYKPFITAVFYEGIMVGNGMNFRPKASITRQEMAKVTDTLLG